MPRPDRKTSAIGFAMKAGKVQSGDFIAEKLLRAGKAKLLLLDEAASDNTSEKYRALCESRGVALLRVGELGLWIGKPGRMTAAVTDEHFAAMIKRAFAEETAKGE